jgi:hypothetical protein
MIFAAAPPPPASATFPVRGRSVTLQKLQGQELLAWGKLHLEAAAQVVQGIRLAKTGKDLALRGALKMIYHSQRALVGLALVDQDFAASLSPLEQRLVVARQQLLQDDQAVPSDPIQPATAPVWVNGGGVLLGAMSGDALIDWAGTQVLCAQEHVKADQLAKRGRKRQLKESLLLLARAEISLAARAAGDGPAMTEAQRRTIIRAQDDLNEMADLAPILGTYAERAYLKIGL